MQNIISLGLTLFAGLFFLIGFFLVRFIKRKKELSIFAVSMAFIVMIGIIFLDLMPEIFELINITNYSQTGKIFFVLGFAFIGVLLLKLLDFFVPHHHHEHHESEKNHQEHQEHLFHIGFVTASSLILHNIIEGSSIYLMGLESFSGGLLMAFAVGLHNLPLGIEIASSFDALKKNQRIKNIFMICLSLSSMFGGIIFFLFGKYFSNIVLVAIMCLSLGMILYLALFELLKELYGYKKQKEVFYGMISGIIVLLCMSFIG